MGSKVIDIETGKELLTVSHLMDDMVAVTPDGQCAITPDLDYNLVIWDIVTGVEQGKLVGHTARIFSVSFSGDGGYAVSASEDETLRVWDIITLREVARFTGEGAFWSCTVALDGVTVVAGDHSGRVHFLRLEGIPHIESALPERSLVSSDRQHS